MTINFSKLTTKRNMQRYLLVIAYTFLLLLFAYVVQKSVKI